MGMEYERIREKQDGISREVKDTQSLGASFERNKEDLQNEYHKIEASDLPNSEKERLKAQIVSYQEQLKRKFDEDVQKSIEVQSRSREEMYTETQKNIENLRRAIGNLSAFHAQANVDASSIEKGKEIASESAKLHEQMTNKYRQEHARAEAEIRRQRSRVFTRVGR